MTDSLFRASRGICELARTSAAEPARTQPKAAILVTEVL
jgi:hypothetical protein